MEQDYKGGAELRKMAIGFLIIGGLFGAVTGYAHKGFPGLLIYALLGLMVGGVLALIVLVHHRE